MSELKLNMWYKYLRKVKGDRHLQTAQTGQGREDYCHPDAHQETPSAASQAYRRYV